MKQCRKCKKITPISNFTKKNANRDKLTSICKDCVRVENRHNREKNKEKQKEYAKQYKHINKERVLQWTRDWRIRNPDYAIKRKYNLTQEDFDGMIEEQNNTCIICGESFLNTKPIVDHDHYNMKVRGLLCKYCNTALGFARDSYEVAFNMFLYLKKHTKE